MSAERSILKPLLRAVFGLALLALLVTRLDLDRVLQVLLGASRPALALAVAAQLASKVIWSWRWRAILLWTGIRRTWLDLFGLVFVGFFFNSFLPTTMGGDLARGYYAAAGRGRLASGYSVVLVERALGLLTVGVMAAAASGIALAVGGGTLPRGWLLAAAGVGLGVASGVAGLFAWRGWRAILLRRIAGRRGSAALLRLLDGFDLFRRPGAPRTGILAATVLVQVVVVLFHLACARAVGLGTPAALFFLLVPAAVIAGMLPVTLNGLGIREGVFVGLLTLAGELPERAAAFALLALAISSLFALAGGVVFVLRRDRAMPGGGAWRSPAAARKVEG